MFERNAKNCRDILQIQKKILIIYLLTSSAFTIHVITDSEPRKIIMHSRGNIEYNNQQNGRLIRTLYFSPYRIKNNRMTNKLVRPAFLKRNSPVAIRDRADSEPRKIITRGTIPNKYNNQIIN